MYRQSFDDGLSTMKSQLWPTIGGWGEGEVGEFGSIVKADAPVSLEASWD